MTFPMHNFLLVEAPASLRPVTWKPPASWAAEPSASDMALRSIRRTHGATGAAEMSPGKDFRPLLGQRWGALMRDTFASTAACAAFFGVDDRAARNWWADSCPSSAHLARALATIPGAAARLLPEGIA